MMKRREFLKSLAGLALVPVLGKVAKAAGLATKTEVVPKIESVTKVVGLGQSSPALSLPPFGMQVSFAEATETYAASLVKSANELVQAEEFAHSMQQVLGVLEPSIEALEQLRYYEIVIDKEELDGWVRDLQMVASNI